MEERLEYRLYLMQGDLEKLKYDYEMEYRKIDWMNRRTDMYLSRVKISGQVIITAILAMIAIYWVFVTRNDLLGGFGNPIFVLIGKAMAYVAIFANLLILFFLILPWSFAMLKNFRMYLKSSNGYGSHLYAMMKGKDYQKERREAEENVYAMSNRIIQMEFEIEQLTQQVEEKQKKEAETTKRQINRSFEKAAGTVIGQLETSETINYEAEDIKQKSSEEIQRHLYHLESIEGNLQKQYDREYGITQKIENKNAAQGHNIRKAVLMFCCGLGGVLISGAVKMINLTMLHNTVFTYGAPILGAGFVVILVLPSAFIVGKELISRYINSEKFIGKEYVDKVKEMSMTTEQMENEKALTEISKKIARIQAEREELEEVLRRKLESENR